MLNRRLILVLAISLLCRSAFAQLAITEAMSSASTNKGSTLIVQNSDWWELTNFGTNSMDLTGYRWNDNAGGLITPDSEPFNGLTIGPGESVIFCNSNFPASTAPEQFRQWWNIPDTVKVVMYQANGLGSTGDGIRVWNATATLDSDVVDSVDFLDAARGSTFTYNPQTGVFGWISTNGVDGAFIAGSADDIGSPGTTTGPVPVVLLTQPADFTANPGDTAQFTIAAGGLPKPRYQWLFKGVPINGAQSATLQISNVQSNNAGAYSVVLDNGLTSLTSSNAILTVNPAPAPPEFVLSPKNQSVFVGQSLSFVSLASGSPQPAYRWYHDGVLIAGANGTSYSISGAVTNDTGTYTVIASNRLGFATNSATLLVTPRPHLVITEIMAAQSTNGPFGGHNDWFELSNFDDFTVDLTGYRFDDSSALLSSATTITNHVTIAPGESVVFVENSSPDSFRAWWGANNLANVQIITYRGAGLGLSSLGDAVNLWNSGATEDFDTIASEVFSTATNGVSFGYDADSQTFGDLSEEGLRGAFRAVQNGDIGSPGYIRNPVNPRLLTFTHTGTTSEFRFTSIAGRNYSLQFKNDLNETEWSTKAAGIPATGSFTTFTDNAAGGLQRFYRFVLEP